MGQHFLPSVNLHALHAPADITFEQVAGLFSRPSLATSFPGTGNTIAYAAHDNTSPLVPFKWVGLGGSLAPGKRPYLAIHRPILVWLALL